MTDAVVVAGEAEAEAEAGTPDRPYAANAVARNAAIRVGAFMASLSWRSGARDRTYIIALATEAGGAVACDTVHPMTRVSTLSTFCSKAEARSINPRINDNGRIPT